MLMLPRHDAPSPDGFTLPVILLIGVGLMIVGLSLFQSTSSIRDSLDYQYQQRINQEAAEAGTVYANYCLSANSFTQTWGPANSKPNLSQNTDCNGDPLSYAPTYLMQNGTKRTSFSIGDLTVRSDGAIIFPSSGTYQQTVGGSSQIANSTNSTRKQVVKWKTYKASVSASGTYKTCAIVTSELYCWGINSGPYATEYFNGQLGDGTNTDSLVPVKVVQAPGVLQGKIVDAIISEQAHNCALAQGSVYCWGRNTSGQLGNGTTTDSSVPVLVGGLLAGKVVTEIGGATDTTCAIAENEIYCWGRNDKGQLGIGNTTAVSTPTKITTTNFGSPYTPTLLSTSGSRAKSMCAVINGKAYCWGANEIGQLGDGTTTNRNIPTKVVDTGVLSGKTIKSISQDGYYDGATGNYPHVCVVASDDKAYCWGANGNGQLGDNTTTNRTSPVAVRANNGTPPDALYGKVVQDIVVGLQHSCALANSKVYCWGDNSVGQVGDNTGADKRVPVAIYTGGDLGTRTVTALGGGSNRGCAVADLTNYCWGKNQQGQLGDGTQTNRLQPTKSVFLLPKAPAYVF